METAVFGMEEEPDGCNDDSGKDEGEEGKVDFVVYFGGVETAGAGNRWGASNEVWCRCHGSLSAAPSAGVGGLCYAWNVNGDGIENVGKADGID